MRSNLFFVLALYTSSAAAWPWPANLGGNGIKDVGAVFRRQNSDSSTQAASPGSTNTTPTQTTNAASGTGSGTAKTTGTQTTGGSKATGGSKNSTTTEYDPRDPAGGVSMVTPAATAGSQYYKIGDWVHFAWNYTSLSATPTAVNIVASCSQNQATYTLASNQSALATEVYWDTGNYQQTAQVPLLTNQYTLIIWDANEQMTAAAKPGYLGSYGSYTFGMYVPQKYTPWSDYRCPTCLGSGASALEKMTWTFLFGTAGITILTFTWFANSFGIA